MGGGDQAGAAEKGGGLAGWLAACFAGMMLSVHDRAGNGARLGDNGFICCALRGLTVLRPGAAIPWSLVAPRRCVATVAAAAADCCCDSGIPDPDLASRREERGVGRLSMWDGGVLVGKKARMQQQEREQEAADNESQDGCTRFKLWDGPRKGTVAFDDGDILNNSSGGYRGDDEGDEDGT
ncbi:hypothetical protein EJ06DRAFT_521622 [Trichodelitschia bisporula]|uniref:Uncharacterized protein n=1 Tax=Trichodelitschia bisporula TaxID=703511 RepID=A0A6G1HY37_9PEZI|nr:hypothetical protein EJ06DRAFT_521622 [Trichodelitschia bisporula]